MKDTDLSQMDPYGVRALRYVQEHCPSRYAAIEDPVTFFSDLGDQIRDQVLALEETLGGPTLPDEDWMAGEGRRNMARLMAEERAFSELVYQAIPPEDLETEDPERVWEPLVPGLPPNEGEPTE